MKRVFIIHGWDGTPDEGWLKWIREELEKKGFAVTAPQMPNAEEPRMEEWIPFVAELVGEPDEDTCFIGHSMGTQTIMRYLQTIHPRKVGGVVLVAGFFNLINLENEESKRIAAPWLETPIDFEKIKNATSNFRVLLSDNDEWVDLESNKKIFQDKLGAEVIVKENKGHFTEDDDAEQLPEVLEFFN